MIRVIEATIAVLIVISALLVFISRQEIKTEGDKSELIRDMLNEISKNLTLREEILADTAASEEAESKLLIAVQERAANPRLEFNVSICNVGEDCGGTGSYPGNAGNIYSRERVITASPALFGPKIVKIYVWVK